MTQQGCRHLFAGAFLQQIGCVEMPQGMQGLEPVADPMMLKYRSASRELLFKADIAK